MKEIFFYACETLITIIKIQCSFHLVEAIAKPRCEKYVIWMGKSFACIVVTLLDVLNIWIVKYTFSNGSLLISILLLFFSSICMYRGKNLNIFCVIFILWSGGAIVDFFFQTLSYAFFDIVGLSADTFLGITVERGIYLILLAAGIWWCVHKLSRWVEKYYSYHQIHWFIKSGFIFVIGCLVVYFQRIYIRVFSEKYLMSWGLFIMGGSILILCGILYFTRQNQEWNEKMVEVKSQMLVNGYQQMQNLYQSREILIHDMKNHLKTIQIMAQENNDHNILCYVDPLVNGLQNNTKLVNTNHFELDIVLNMKIQEAEQKGIAIQAVCDDMTELKMQTKDICSLFSNILDNAIEANEKVEKDSPKWIHFSCERRGNMLVVNVSNPVAGKLEEREGRLQSTKKDEGIHGLGMISMQRVVESYHGYQNIRILDGVFSLVLYLEAFSNESMG
jgi:sensor histidine kinase YesM